MDENMRVLPVRKDGKFCYNIILKADFTKLGEHAPEIYFFALSTEVSRSNPFARLEAMALDNVHPVP